MSIIKANKWQTATGSTVGTVLQTKYVHKTNTWSATCSGATMYDVTGLAVTITPYFATSLILITATLYVGANQNSYNLRYTIKRNSVTPILGDAEGGRAQSTGYVNPYDNDTTTGAYQVANVGGVHMDAPATTSALTYQVQVAGYSGSTIYLNRSHNWQNNPALGYDSQPVSSLIIQEIAQ